MFRFLNRAPLALVMASVLTFGCGPGTASKPADPQAEGDAEADSFSQLEGPFLGQTPPGLTPQLFGQDLISLPNRDEAGIVVSPGGCEIFFWTVEPGAEGEGPTVTIFVTRERDGGWTTPEVASFSGQHADMYAAMHPDGSRLYFQSDRPMDSSVSSFPYNLWYVDRQGEGWGEAKPMGSPVNGGGVTGGASVTQDGTLYFMLMDLEAGSSDLYRSDFLDGVYQKPERLPDGVNAFHQNTDGYVHPDGRYLVFSAFPRSGHQNNPGDLYIAYRHEGGGWSAAEKLGPVLNSDDQFGSVTLSPDGRYLFFTRARAEGAGEGRLGLDLYWVDAAILDRSGGF